MSINRQAYEENMRKQIDEHGWFIVTVMAERTRPAFAYTVGLQQTLDHAELLVLGLPLDTAFNLLEGISQHVRDKGPVELDKACYDFTKGDFPVQLKALHPQNIVPEYLVYAMKHAGTWDIKALQVVWSDENRRFPWELGYDDKFKQPLLDTPLYFKITIEEDQPVYAGEDVINGAPVLLVRRDPEGDWMFLADETVDTVQPLSIEQLTGKDPSLFVLWDMQPGQDAWRTAPGEAWIRQQAKT